MLPRIAFFVAAFTLAGAGAPAKDDSSATGLWKTIDDKTGKARGLVRIYEENGLLFGKVESSFDPAEANENCDKCTDERKNKPVVGMVIVRGMEKRGEEYSGGDILDPETGAVYRCKFRLAERGMKLIVRGFLGLPILGRNQIWLREK